MLKLRLNYRSCRKKLLLKLAQSILAVLVFDFLLFPLPTLAKEYRIASFENNFKIQNLETTQNKLKTENDNNKAYKEFQNHLPASNYRKVVEKKFVTITAYSSDVDQCDQSPCITANGFNLCEHNQEDSVAVNFLPFGTKIRIPDMFDEKIFVVRDRMNSRYSDRVDVWMTERDKARKFGVRVAEIEILE